MAPPPDPALPGLDGYVKHRRPRGKSTKIIVKVGSVSVPIYKLKDRRFLISYRERKGGPIRKVFRRSEKEAKAKAAEICLEIARGQISANRLSDDTRLQAATAEKLLSPLGLTLDVAAREIVRAHELTGGAGIAEMARFWAQHHVNASGAAMPLADIHAALLHSLADQDLAPRWRQSLTKDLKKFVDAFEGTKIGEILSDNILAWLREQSGNWRTRNNRLQLVRQFFRFARLNGNLPQDRITEAEKIKPLKRPRGAHSRIGVLSATELSDLINHVGNKWLPYVALGAFAGLRRDEVMRLSWSDILWDQRLVHIRQEVAKSTRRKAGDERYVPMRDQLMSWLKPWHGRAEGTVCEVKNFDDERTRLKKTFIGTDDDAPDRRTVVRGPWPKNALRHTYGSCRTAETCNMDTVAKEMGNSVAEIRRDYNNPRTDREVAAWASIFPPDRAENVIPMAGAKK